MDMRYEMRLYPTRKQPFTVAEINKESDRRNGDLRDPEKRIVLK